MSLMSKEKQMIDRLILSGGGTGGHIYPALAIYNRLKEINPQLKCLYIGTQKGLEADIVRNIDDIQFEAIEISGLKRSLSPSNLKVIWQMLTSTHQAKKIIKRYKPDAVLGTGGFVCAPVLNAAADLKIPTLIHEQNSVAGITNKFLSRKVTKIATSFREVHKDFAKYAEKLVFTGNPRGQEVNSYPNNSHILSENFQLKDNLPTVLVFGGSRGAPAINQAAIESIPNFKNKPYQVVIGTGSVHYQECLDYLKDHHISLPDNVRMVDYINDMPALMKQVSLIVSRSGATTISEISSLGMASIFIPSPYVTNNHQEHNAMALVNRDAAKLIRQENLTSQKLFEEIDDLMNHPEKIQTMANNAKKFGTPHATDDIIKILMEIK